MKKNYIYASITVVIWATLAPVVKLLLTDIPSFEALAISSAFAFVFLLIVNIFSGSIKLMKTYRFKDYLIMAGLGFIGLFSVLNKKRGYYQSITMMIIWLTTAVCSFIAGLFVENFKPVEGLQWLGMVWLGVVINAVAYLLWAIALKGAKDSAKIANLAYLVPFLSILLSWLVLKEQITIYALFALILIVGGILLQSINIKRRSKAK